MATAIVTVQINPSVEIIMLAPPVANPNDLIYSKGGGDILANLKQDIVEGGNLYHGGNPPISIDYSVKGCQNLSVVSTPVTTESNLLDRGLIYFNSISNKYYWDEIYTTPLGVYTQNDTPNSSSYEFTISTGAGIAGNQLLVSIKDINIFPKVDDFIIIQKISDSTIFNNDSFTDDIHSLPVFLNSELYQFKITQVLVDSGSGDSVIYRLYLDKSITLLTGGKYTLILLNRENTGIQKELFYDTFEQIEIHRNQLLGDPYNNTSNLALPIGRKNYLNYTGFSYLGLATLTRNILNSEKTPFLVYDINDEIKDRFKPELNTIEFLLPFVLIQEDTRTNSNLNLPNKLINSSEILFEENGVGNYSGLYFDWDTSLSKRIGWVFYELRILIIDDSEVVNSLSYNSNRNYTLPKANLVTGLGNDLPTPGGGVELKVEGLEVINTNQVVIRTTDPHGLLDGTEVFIADVYVTDSNNNTIPASANGTRYAKLLTPNDLYKFQLYSDPSLTIPVVSNGTFTIISTNTGTVKGTTPRYEYFYTYRLIGKHYDSILPYSQITDFNFVKNSKVDNLSVDSQLSLTISNLKWLIDSVNTEGFEADDLELIIGNYRNDDPINPQRITGFDNVVTIPITELINSRSLKTGSIQSDFSTPGNALKITLSDYNTFVSKIGGSGVYNKTSNPNGDPTYNIVSNYSHYTYTNGDPTPADLVVGKGKWTLGNIKYRSQVEKYRSSIRITIPADKWNDTTNPTYDIENEFIKDRFISEIGIVVQDAITKTEKPMIYTKVAPAIKKTTDLDIIINLQLDW